MHESSRPTAGDQSPATRRDDSAIGLFEKKSGEVFTGSDAQDFSLASDATRLSAILRAHVNPIKPETLQTANRKKEAWLTGMPKEDQLLLPALEKSSPTMNELPALETLLEKLAERLELELLRTYGTSGR